MQEESIGGTCYYLLFKDDCIEYKFVYCIKNKLEAVSCFKTLVKTMLREIKCIIKTLKIDWGGKFCSKEFKHFLVTKNIIHEINMSCNPKQNWCIERNNRTIAKAAHNMLYVKGLPFYLWGEAIHITVYLFNRTSPTCLGDKTPYEIWHGTKPIVSHYQVFGYFAYVFINKQMHSKLDA